MPDLILSWGDVAGGYNTELLGPETVDAGGVAVTVVHTAQDADASIYAVNTPTYTEAGEAIPYASGLKLLGSGGDGGGLSDTSSTTMTFSSTDDLYDDSVADLTFRIHDVDAGTSYDTDGSPGGTAHADNVVIRAFAPDGTEIPVTITPGSDVTQSGNTLDGTVDSNPWDGNSSSLISVAGPVGSIVIDYNNGDVGDQNVIVSDLVFTTIDAGPNDDPIANPDTAVTAVDTLLEDIDILGNDSDPNGDPLTVETATAPNGIVTINSDGTLDYDPAPGFSGVDTITYTISDGAGGTATSTVTVTVSDDPNSLPVAVDDTATAVSEVPLLNIDVLGNDSDPDGDPLTVTTATAPNGTVTINSDGSLNYTSDTDFVGEDTISYTIDDGVSGTATASVIVTVGLPGGENTAPIAANDQIIVVTDTLVEDIDILGNDSDPDGDPLTVTSAVSDNGATVVINSDGTLDYTSPLGFEGTDLVRYTIDDGRGGTDEGIVRVSVRDSIPGNTAPTPVDDVAETPVDTAITGLDVLGNDSDPDGDPLTVVAATSPFGTVVINSDDTLDYTPDPGFEGIDTITYTVSDGRGGTVSAAVTVTVGDPLDGIVEGTPGDDLIDVAYTGDPDGDMIDNGDAILPGEGPEDDIVIAGDGNDTVLGGLGDDDIDTSGTAPAVDSTSFPSVPVDGDPTNDLDSVDGGAGDDLIRTGDDNDTIFGGDGDDTIFAGIDDDSVLGGAGDDSIIDDQGADFVDGGAGDDTISVGTDTFSDYVGDDPNLPLTDGGTTFVTDPNQDDGRDTVFGGAGNDVITTGDDADLIFGGSDNDTINAGIDDDTVDGGSGDDSIIGGHGSDSIVGGLGDDYIDASSSTLNFPDEPDATEPAGLEFNDRDTVFGGSGDDTILGGDDADSISGGAGDDSIDGGIDDDTIAGDGGDDIISGGDGDDVIASGSGADTVTGGEGADSIFTGAGEDSIIGATAGDTVDGGSGPVDFDTLNLTSASLAQQALGGRIDVTYTSADREDGFVRFLDAADLETGRMTFEDIENVIPCFTPGTMIATPQGERRVEDLQVGDRVITRDNGIQEIRWTGAKELSGAQLASHAHLQPVLIRAGALGDNLPERDILVSPQHRMLLTTDQAAMYFEEREVLVAAKHLTLLDGVDIVESSGTTYIHIMFDQHEVVLSNGTWSESFQPGDYTLDGIGAEQRAEILELFPELATQQGVDAYQSARRALKKYEADLLLG